MERPKNKKAMPDRPLVSCVVIFYNAAAFIEETIESVLAQSYRRWELLLVDDGSTDRSTEIARRFAAAYPGKIHYLQHDNHQNRGMSASRNLGASKAEGKYLALLDADDIWLPHKLARQVDILENQEEAAMVLGPSLLWHSWTGKERDKNLDSLRQLKVESGKLHKAPALFSLYRRTAPWTPATCSVLIRREVFAKHGGFEASMPTLYEDQVFFSKIYLNEAVYITQQCLDKYRQHPASCCATAQQDEGFSITDPNPYHHKYMLWLGQYLDDNAINDKRIRRIYRINMWPYRHPFIYLVFFGHWKNMARKLLPGSVVNWLRHPWPIKRRLTSEDRFASLES